ncbi:unnamed protein product [Echinostoma caproni]|uniref:BPTI/Kunitz inhibitor domain-containing protein n=1 Tax=Echinostoma caproni TaxID=27848 RepID=A0A183BB44_9TREM|nr:unnamed protein product [Echinostoma caproni]
MFNSVFFEIYFSELCLLPVDPGPCFGGIKSWAWDSNEGTCVPFLYGGCRGNRNRFHSRRSCERRCVVRLETPKTVERSKYRNVHPNTRRLTLDRAAESSDFKGASRQVHKNDTAQADILHGKSPS